jgi:hypothetical protein
MGRENTIRTGVSVPNRMLDMASNMRNSRINFAPPFKYGLVKMVNTTTRQIIYSILESNIPSSKTGIAIPISTNFSKLPEPNNIVKVFIGPDTDASIANIPGSTTVYYDPNPVGVWQTVDNNKIDQGPTLNKEAKEKSVNPKDLKQVITGIPHNKPNKPTTSKAGSTATHSIIISKPLASDNSFAIVIGGTKSIYFGAAFMKKEAETAGIISNKNIVFSDWENSTESIMNTVKKDYPNATFSSFSGFSKGGENASGEIGNFPFIGFIDPSLNASVLAISKNNPNPPITNSSCYMMYNPANWDNDYPTLAARQRAAGPKMGKRATLVNQGHGKFPVLFFQTYGNKL